MRATTGATLQSAAGPRVAFVVVALLLLAAKPVAGYHLSTLPDPGTDTVDTRNRIVATYTKSLDDAPAGNLLTHTVPWDPEYSFQDVGHTIRVRIGYTATFPSSSNGAWTVSVSREGPVALADCAVRVETIDPPGITLDALPIYAHYAWDCTFTVSQNAHYHSHTVFVNRAVASGTPAAMTAEVVSVRLETEDLVKTGNVLDEIQDHRNHTIELTMHENQFAGFGFDGFVLILFWGGMLIWCLRNAKLMAALVCTIGLIMSFIPAFDKPVLYMMLLAFALWLEAMAGEKIYSRFLKKHTGDTPGNDTRKGDT